MEKLYEEVKQLWNSEEETISLYFNLKARVLNISDNILIICKKKESINKINCLLKNLIEDMNDMQILIKTIEECKHLEGYRFKKIIFFDQ